MWEFYQKNPRPSPRGFALFEEKVVDHLLSQVKVDESTASKSLFGDDETKEAESASVAETARDGGSEKAAKGEPAASE